LYEVHDREWLSGRGEGKKGEQSHSFFEGKDKFVEVESKEVGDGASDVRVREQGSLNLREEDLVASIEGHKVWGVRESRLLNENVIDCKGNVKDAKKA